MPADLGPKRPLADTPCPDAPGASPVPCHPACVACRPIPDGGLGLHFDSAGDGGVITQVFCDPGYRSYPDRLHGGYVALLIDAAMGHCLFHHGVIAVTGRLNVGFREPVKTGQLAEIRTHIIQRDADFCRLRAEIRQNGRIRVRAEGKFSPADPPST